jgi:hypothetical protein
MLRVIIGGDICPMGKIQKAFQAADAPAIFGDLLDEISRADVSLANLECPLITKEAPISKAGPVLGASLGSIKGIKAAGWDILNLANNHSFDHGEQGLLETIRGIHEAGIALVGVGMTLREAQTPYVAEVGNQRVVFYSMAEREFSLADHDMAGANPLDIIDFVRAIEQNKKNGIFITLIHGGKEFYPYPSPEMIKRCRFMIDMGADAVVCCHAHCPLPWELYKGKPIVYGLGNLIFEPAWRQPEEWYEGYLASLTFCEGDVAFEPIPYIQSFQIPGARRMTKDRRESFLAGMQKKGSRFDEGDFLDRHWEDYCLRQKEAYLLGLFAYRRPLLRLRKALKPLLHSEESILRALLLAQCETHREILATILKEMRKGKISPITRKNQPELP